VRKTPLIALFPPIFQAWEIGATSSFLHNVIDMPLEANGLKLKPSKMVAIQQGDGPYCVPKEGSRSA